MVEVDVGEVTSGWGVLAGNLVTPYHVGVNKVVEVSVFSVFDVALTDVGCSGETVTGTLDGGAEVVVGETVYVFVGCK